MPKDPTPTLEWEHVHSRGDHDETYRLRIPGGWLYRNVLTPFSEDTPLSVSLVFVPGAA